jgi:hypothetical protein
MAPKHHCHGGGEDRLIGQRSVRRIACPGNLTAGMALIPPSLQPENEVQAAVAVHIACLHTATINVLKRMHKNAKRGFFGRFGVTGRAQFRNGACFLACSVIS